MGDILFKLALVINKANIMSYARKIGIISELD